MERITKIIASAEDAADMRRRMGAAALDMDAASDGSWQTQWRVTVAATMLRWANWDTVVQGSIQHPGTIFVGNGGDQNECTRNEHESPGHN